MIDKDNKIDGNFFHNKACTCSACNGSSGGEESPFEGDNSKAPSSAGTYQELATFIRTAWSIDRKYNLSSTGLNPNNGKLLYNFSSGFSFYGTPDSDGITEGRKTLARETFKLIEATTGIDFEETSSTGSDTDFYFKDSENFSAYCGATGYSSGVDFSYINVGYYWFDGVSSYTSSNLGDYTSQTYTHEILHGLGLYHLGNYNGNWNWDELAYTNDSWQASIMSYVAQNNNPNISADKAFIQTPMVADWIALDDIYSSEGFGLSNAFHGDTIYGFNTNISSDVSLIWNQFSTNASSSAYTIVDGKGNDTIDLSGFSDNQTIDLRPTEKSSSTPYVSNIGGLNGNLCIAPGTYIESAIGGSGNDELIGNNENNTLNGGSGNDTLIGGAGDDTYVVDSTSDTVTEKSSEGTDLIQSSVTFTASNNVENLTLTGSGNINATGNTLDNTLTGNTRNNTLNGGSGNDTLIGGNGDDILIGGNGNDTAQFSLDIYNYKVWKGTNLIVTDKKLNRGGKDQLSSIETISLNGTSIDISNLRTGMYVHSN
ncbi:M10 family metallopeptidase, partial [Prochlorococcus marinus]|nr:hypothetical protein [Prochlorococcus marinus str. MU1416]